MDWLRDPISDIELELSKVNKLWSIQAFGRPSQRGAELIARRLREVRARLDRLIEELEE